MVDGTMTRLLWLRERLNNMKNNSCKWIKKNNYFITQCNNETEIMYEINKNYRYCPYCGKRIIR